MITQQQAANTAFEVSGGIGGTRAAGRDARSRPMRRLHGRREDLAHQLEAERRDLATVAVLGYN